MNGRSWDPSRPIVSIRDVHKSFGDLQVLKGVTFDVMKGEVICIIGPSGSGKSTLIRCVNALTPIDSGSIEVEGQEVHAPNLDKLELRRKVGMVFQQYNLFPHKTALANVMMAPVLVLKEPKGEVEERARALIRKVRLGGKGGQLPGRAVGRTAAARRHRALARDAPRHHALRRDHRRPRSGDGEGGAGRHPPARGGGHDLPPRDPRNGVRAPSLQTTSTSPTAG